jgi:hypothetical protein
MFGRLKYGSVTSSDVSGGFTSSTSLENIRSQIIFSASQFTSIPYKSQPGSSAAAEHMSLTFSNGLR